MEKQYYVYILTNYRNTVLYIGITSNLCKRIWEHQQDLVEGFTKKYHVHKLIFYESYNDSLTAIKREKQLKNWSRKKKNTLILKQNPELNDLFPQLCS